jgi:hypothetical protein
MYISGGKREAEGESIFIADFFRSLEICNFLEPWLSSGIQYHGVAGSMQRSSRRR